MKLNWKRTILAALPLITIMQFAFATCPTSGPDPMCLEPIREAWGCGTYGEDCCYYVTYRCPGSPTTTTIWTTFPGWSCSYDNIEHGYICTLSQ
jgi:hypothetical protein